MTRSRPWALVWLLAAMGSSYPCAAAVANLDVADGCEAKLFASAPDGSLFVGERYDPGVGWPDENVFSQCF